MKNFIQNIKYYYLNGISVISALLLVGCMSTNSKGDMPEIQEKRYKTEIVYFYNITDFASYFLQNFQENIDAGFFMRDPGLFFDWESGDMKKNFYSFQGSVENSYYHTTIHLSQEESNELILIEDENLNLQPKSFVIQLEETSSQSNAEGYPLKSVTMDYQLFESIIRVFLKDKAGKLEIMDPYNEDYSFDLKEFNERGFGMGEKKLNSSQIW